MCIYVLYDLFDIHIDYTYCRWIDRYSFTHTQVPVGNMPVVHGVIMRISAVDLDEASVVDVTRILQFIKDVACFIFHQQSCGGRAQCTHRQLLWEHVHDKGVKCLHTGQLMSDVHPTRLITKLQEQHSWRKTERERERQSEAI